MAKKMGAVAFNWPLIIRAIYRAAPEWPFDSKGHKTNWERLPTSYLHAKFEQNRSINGRDAYKGRCGLCLAFDGKGHETNWERLLTSYLHAKFEQNRSKNGQDAFKGRCGLFLAFVGKGHEINWERLPISYLHTKCEQNRWTDSWEIACLVFKAIRPFFKTLKRVHRRSKF